MYKQKLDDILSQEMSRQDFLRASGMLMLTLMGLPALLQSVSKLFGSPHKQKPLTDQNSSGGYGGRAYGK